MAFVLLLGARGMDGAAEQLRGIAWLIVLGLPVLVVLAVLRVQEGRPEGFVHERRNFLAGLRLVVRNPAFGRMIGCVVLFVSGIAIQDTLHRLVLADVMGEASHFPLMIFIENLATLAAVPLWLWLSLRIGKHRALMAAALWLAALSLPLTLLREGDTELPAGFGYDPAVAVTAPDVQVRLMVIYGLVPALMMAVGVLFLRRFPITRERHAEARTALEARSGGFAET